MVFNIVIKAKAVWSGHYDKVVLRTTLAATVSPILAILTDLYYHRPVSSPWGPVVAFVLMYLICWALRERSAPEIADEGLEEQALPDDVWRMYYG